MDTRFEFTQGPAMPVTMVSRKPKKEKKQKQIYFPDEVWSQIKGFMIGDDKIMRIVVMKTTRDLIELPGDITENIAKKLENDGISFITLIQNKRWTAKCEKYFKKKIKKTYKRTLDPNDWIRRSTLIENVERVKREIKSQQKYMDYEPLVQPPKFSAEWIIKNYEYQKQFALPTTPEEQYLMYHKRISAQFYELKKCCDAIKAINPEFNGLALIKKIIGYK